MVSPNNSVSWKSPCGPKKPRPRFQFQLEQDRKKVDALAEEIRTLRAILVEAEIIAPDQQPLSVSK